MRYGTATFHLVGFLFPVTDPFQTLKYINNSILTLIFPIL